MRLRLCEAPSSLRDRHNCPWNCLRHGAQVPSYAPVAPSQQPPLPGSLGDACLGEGPNLSGLLLDHVSFMRCVVRTSCCACSLSCAKHCQSVFCWWRSSRAQVFMQTITDVQPCLHCQLIACCNGLTTIRNDTTDNDT